MKRKIRVFVMVMLVSLLFFGSSFNTYAFSSNMEKDLGFVSEGYTEDGIHYYVYRCIYGESEFTTSKSSLNNSPRIVVSKYVSDYQIIYDGYITPPSTFNYDQYDNGHKVQMRGNLNLQSYVHNDYPTWTGCTIAKYSGYVFGNL